MEKLYQDNIEDILALTPLQEGILFYYLKETQREIYFEQLSLGISGIIDLQLFEKAWNMVVEINEMLRTVFRWEKMAKPAQLILKTWPCEVKFYNLMEMDNDNKRSTLEEIKTKDRAAGFDLTRVPFRVILCKLDENCYELVISNHHILYDGWSNGIILKEFFNAYQSLHLGKPTLKCPTKTPFKEFIKWVQNQDRYKQKQYWSDYLAGFETSTELTIKKKKEGAIGVGKYSITLTKELETKLNVFIKNYRFTLASVFYTAWGILLQKYCSSEDVLFGTTVSGRTGTIKGIENTVGLFINTIPLRIDTSPYEKLIDVVLRTNQVLRERETFGHTPLVDIGGRDAASGRDVARNVSTLFDTIVVIENYPLDDVVRRDVARNVFTVQSYSMEETTHYDLTVGIMLFDTIEIIFSFKQDLFEKDAIKNLAAHFKSIIQKIIEQPEMALSQLEIISIEEKKRILYEFNNTAVEYPANKTIHQLFTEQAERIPDYIGLHGCMIAWMHDCMDAWMDGEVARNVSLTYQQLNEQSDRLGGLLIEKGVLPDSIVGIMMERSIEMIISILGILNSGAAYLPIDPAYPQDRIDFMLKDSQTKILITNKSEIRNPKLETNPNKTNSNDQNKKQYFGAASVLDFEHLNLSSLNGRPRRGLQHSAFRILHSNHLCYVIYTSGSTGKPKAVMVEHYSAVNLLFAMQDIYPVTPSDTYLLKTSYIFDVSVTELFGWILGGGKLTILEKNGEKDPFIICKSIAFHYVSHINFVPSMFHVFLSQLDSQNIKQLSSLKYIFLAGEALLPGSVNKFRGLDTNIKLENIYGPTENSVYASKYSLTDWNGTGNIPIGKPMPNVKLYIFDKYNHLQPPGITGELVISGLGLARGYLNRPELTDQKFYRSYGSYKTYILYKTGDLARWLPAAPPAGGGSGGVIEFLGRIDHQVKIRGFRIELGEIENRLLDIPELKESVVSIHEETSDKYICAYFVADRKFDEMELRQTLSKQLPDYMVPAYFVQLEKMLLTPTGKVNRSALPAPGMKTREIYAAPRNKVEKKLVEIWAEILGKDIIRQPIGINDHFFCLGGHSLKATALVSKIHKEFDVKVSVTEIFKNPTIKGLSRYINNAGVERFVRIEAVEKKEYYVLSSAQKRLYILSRIESGSLSYNMHDVFELEGTLDRKKLRDICKELIARHESLRTSFHLIADEPVQKISPVNETEFSIEYHDLTDELLNPGAVNDINVRFLRPFDLARAPLFRVGLIKIGENRHILMAGMHHIISDGTSVNLFIRDFTKLYRGQELIPLRLQYKDYAHWQQQEKGKDKKKGQAEFWLKEFAGDVPRIAIPYDFPRPAVQDFIGEKFYLEMGETVTLALKKRAQEKNVTLFMILMAIFNVMLWKISGSEDIVVGTPTAGRRHEDLELIMGMFVNTLVLKTYINPGKDRFFKDFLEQVKQKSLAAFENQDFQFEDLVEIIQPDRDLGRNPLFDVLFALQNMNPAAVEIPGLKITPFPFETHIAPLDMYLTAEECGDSLYFTVAYCTKLFKEDTIRRFMGYFKEILTRVAFTEDHLALTEIDILSAGEKHQLLVEFNGIETIYPGDMTIHEWFAQQVERTPDVVASGGQGAFLKNRPLDPQKTFGCLTYRQLNREANHLAHLLRQKGVDRDSIVAVLMPRSIAMLVGLLGILKGGGAYLPVNPEYPAQRIFSILEDSGSRYLLTDSQTAQALTFTVLRGMTKRDISPVITERRTQITDFDSLPHPDRTLVDYRKYHRFIGIAPAKYTVNIQATRGCPYHCAYCHKIWPKKHVVRSAGNIFAEIRACYEAGVKRFVFIDDIFNLHKENSAKLFETIIKHHYHVQFFFPNGLRGDILTPGFIDLMIEAGTVNIALALETASPRLQKLIAKRLNLEKFADNIHYITKKYPHVILELEIMIGFPTETETEAMMSLDFLKCIKWIHFPNLHILKIYPNTDMAQLALAHGITGESITRSAGLAFHELPETLPFSPDFAREYQARLLDDYFLAKERLIHIFRQQVKILSEDELVQKYDSYLPASIKCFQDILNSVGLAKEELGPIEFLPGDEKLMPMAAPDFNEKIKAYPSRYSQNYSGSSRANASFRVLLIDISQSFRLENSAALYDVGAEPLGLMYLATYLHEQLGPVVQVKILKSRIDFNSYEELADEVCLFKPHLIGLRSLSIYKEFFHRTVSVLRHLGITTPIIAGGPYATSDYKQLLQDDDVQLAVLGEGELTLTHLVKEMMAHHHQLPAEEILKTIPGLAYIRQQDKTAPLTAVSREVLLMDYISGQANNFFTDTTDNPKNFNRPGDLLYLISTSGSTGLPKSVMVEHRTMVNLMNYQFQCPGIHFSRVLQFAAIGFDVSLQEIFSALLSGGIVYLPDNDMRSDVLRLFDFIARHKINILFLPPAFLRFIFSEPALAREFPASVRHIITAGEQLIVNEPLRQLLKERHIYLHNHYGPSETHVVTSLTIDPVGEIVEFPTIGKPVQNTGIYIVDKWGNLLPTGAAGELLIGGLQVGRGYLNRPELTAEKFRPQITLMTQMALIKSKINKSFAGVKGELFQKLPLATYKTGDLARWLPDGPPAGGAAKGIIEFLGRIDQQVKIRGFRVEPGEIESRLAKYPGIKQVLVWVREEENRDKYIDAYIVSAQDIEVPKLRDYLAKELPDYMIPSFFIQVEKIPLTSSGKVDYRRLPGPGTIKKDSYVGPRTGIEKKMAVLWAEVLGTDARNVLELQRSIGIDDNFFQLGGHSLKATILISKLHKVFNVKIPLAEVFKHPNIRELSKYIKDAAPWQYEPIELTEKKEYYALSPAQRRLYFLQQKDKGSTAYHISSMMVVAGKVDKGQLERSIRELIQRHESLRTSFHMINDEPVQRIHEEVEFEIKYLAADAGGVHGQTRPPGGGHLLKFIRPFDLSQAPLMRVGLVKPGEEKQILMVDMHHIISDGWSLEVLKKEFFQVYEAKKKDLNFDLKPLQVQYKDYAAWQNRLLGDEEKMGQAKISWKNYLNNAAPVMALPYDFPVDSLKTRESSAYSFFIPGEIAGSLGLLAGERKGSLFIVLLAAFNILLSQITYQDNILVGIPAAARQHPDLQNIAGLFVNTLILQNKVNDGEIFSDFLERFQTNTIHVLEYQEYPLEIIFAELKIKYPEIPAFFNMLNIGSSSLEIISNVNMYHSEDTREAKFPIHCYLSEFKNGIQVECYYFRELFMPASIEKIMQIYLRILENIAASPMKKIKDLAKRIEKN